MKNLQFIFAILLLASCQKEVLDSKPAIEKPALHFTGSTKDTTYNVDFSTNIHGRLDTVHQDEQGNRVFSISAYEKGQSTHLFTIRLLTVSTDSIATGEYYLTPNVINDDAFGFTTTKGVGRYEFKGAEAGSLQVWAGTVWEERTDWAKVIIEKNEDGYVSGVFSGRFTSNEVLYGKMKMTFNGRFENIKVEY